MLCHFWSIFIDIHTFLSKLFQKNGIILLFYISDAMALLGMPNFHNAPSDPNELVNVAANIVRMENEFPKPIDTTEFHELIDKINLEDEFKLKFVSFTVLYILIYNSEIFFIASTIFSLLNVTKIKFSLCHSLIYMTNLLKRFQLQCIEVYSRYFPEMLFTCQFSAN